MLPLTFSSRATLEATKGKETIFILHSATSRRIHFNSLLGATGSP